MLTNTTAIYSQILYMYNLDDSTSSFPDEVLSLIFEIGSASQERYPELGCCFGFRVSAVSRRWRGVALATTKLWTTIWYGYCLTPETMRAPPKWRQRAKILLDRCRSVPVKIHIQHLQENDISLDSLQLIIDHMDHCASLKIDLFHLASLTQVLEHICYQPIPTPLLRFIQLNCGVTGLNLQKQLLPSSGLHLTTVILEDLNPHSFNFCVPAFASVISLSLTQHYTDNTLPGEDEDSIYQLYRHFLMSLPVLTHLELELFALIKDNSSLPITLPTLQSLKLGSPDSCGGSFDDIIFSIHATSLVSLAINPMEIGDSPSYHKVETSMAINFPTLQHLCLGASEVYDLRILSQHYPNIERLTVYTDGDLDVVNLLAIIGLDDDGPTGDSEIWHPEDLTRTAASNRWPKLHTIAVCISGSLTCMGANAMCTKIRALRDAGHPIRTLMLRSENFAKDSRTVLGSLVEIAEFNDDWLYVCIKFHACIFILMIEVIADPTSRVTCGLNFLAFQHCASCRVAIFLYFLINWYSTGYHC